MPGFIPDCPSLCSCGKPCTAGKITHSCHTCGVYPQGCRTFEAQMRLRRATQLVLNGFFDKYKHLGAECREDLILLVSQLVARPANVNSEDWKLKRST